MRKCAVCNSTRVTKQVIDGEYVISCANCNYFNKRDLSSFNNEPQSLYKPFI
jgi:hypothetical protein